MTVMLELPDDLASAFTSSGPDLGRATLEALALEGYRTRRLTEADVRRILGFETRMEVHGFLKERGVALHYTVQDLEHDRQVARLAHNQRQEESIENRLPK
jgi:predicted HTH domain antitoxin